MVLDIGEASTLVRVQSTLQDATRAMDRMTRLLRVEDAEAMLEEGATARERHREFLAALSSGVATTSGDEHEYDVSEAELEALRAELEVSSAAWAAEAPAVPTTAAVVPLGSSRTREKNEREEETDVLIPL
jgi:uncharacterized protein YciI